MNAPLVVVVLAAGKGTRMKSQLPKVLHPLGGRPMIRHVLDTTGRLQPQKTILILGHGADQVRQAVSDGDFAIAIQDPPQGTGHAVMQVMPHLEGYEGDVVIVSGDVPLMTEATLQGLVEAHRQAEAAATILTVELSDPTGYGRILRDAGGRVVGIVEQKDASDDQKRVLEINSGTYVFRWQPLAKALTEITPNNAQGEYYLTDAIRLLVEAGHRVAGHVTEDQEALMGVNDRVDLAEAARLFRQRQNANWMRQGVTLIDPSTTYIDSGVVIGADTVIEPGCHLRGRTQIGSGCHIGPDTDLTHAVVEDGAKVQRSVVTDSRVGPGSQVGPYAHLRGGADVGPNCRIGNFVEIKKSQLAEGVKAAHLTYLGDAQIGRETNVGCGTITCNYDGRHKHPTVIGEGCFIGSDSILVAPLTIGDGATTAAGSVITQDVPALALGVGRARQRNVEEWALRRKDTP